MITVILAALGHLVRDGAPPLGSTHAARGLGGFLCTLGGFFATWDYQGALLGLSLYVGFYADTKHGEGHRARGWMDVPYLLVSGLTSVAPLALCAWWLNDVYWAAAVGILKPAIWTASWRLPIKWSDDPEGILVPTRVAAITWGAVMGTMVVVSLPTASLIPL